MVHYPLFYLYYNYLGFDGNGVSTTFREAWPVALLVVASSLLIAWICMRFYDKPLRRRLLSDSK
jgi:peptidoglycan/LPS O-acetylase OafA/YrhL